MQARSDESASSAARTDVCFTSTPAPTDATAVTFLFSDIEGSTRLWEQEPQRMRPALARHDALSRALVEQHGGTVVKMTGDGVHAAFGDPLAALAAAVDLQLALAQPDPEGGLALKVRCGLHLGADERRDGDFYGPAVNRAARIMSAAHGGQILLSQAVAEGVRPRLPADVSLRDLGAVRLRDLANPERVFQIVHPRLRADFPALRSLEATPNNLAQQLNSFIGRERELQEIRHLIAFNRLVTLLGMGGIGKSRLSVQLGAELLDEFSDGVWLVELAPLADPRMVAQATASVLGVKESAGGDVADALASFVRDRHLLLILDNCEHLLHASAALAKQLLQAGPNVKVLATSRDYLQVAGEAAYHVPPLSAPDPRQPNAPEALAQHAAVQLFVDRARAAQPSFRVDVRNAPAVAQICHRLDGIPLALELAAARTRALSVEAIAARLNDRFRLLVTGDRTVLPRQRTLRALIDWSYDLLPAPERALFERLAVFAGGFTLDAAEAVAAFGDVAQADVLDLLAHLVEKSLVQMEAGGARYRMLETVREYAREKLGATGDAAPARDRHLLYFVDFAERARPELRGPDQGAWLRRIDLELENILAAHAFSQATEGRGTLQWRLVEALRVYWINRGLLSLGLRLNVNLLERDDPPLSDADRCRTLFGAGQICYLMGNYRRARTYLSDCLEVANAIGDSKVAAGVLQPLGMACLAEGDYGAARVHLEHALALARERGDKRETVGALNAVAMLYRLQQRLDQAEPLYAEALDLARAMSHREYTATVLLNLAMVAIGRGRLDEASNMLREVVTIAAETDAKPLVQSTLEVCAGLAAGREDWAHAARFFGIAEAHHKETGLSRDPADEGFLNPLIALARSTLGAQQFDAGMASGRAVTTRGALSEAGKWLAGAPPTA